MKSIDEGLKVSKMALLPIVTAKVKTKFTDVGKEGIKMIIQLLILPPIGVVVQSRPIRIRGWRQW